ncbi:hypothetical protein F511_14197 [Dorcoceras hygrometricum]|uniref:CCHC-type domain-containing protein n=1 Tax=Dorcoceras hygrometricum TaxID=472368 RepID=A0A2Z7C340_9LAMI|nr:hypothetical protein F511_14197 [Dorcoceras hygrometricum]
MFSNKLFNSCSLSCCLFFVTTLRATAVSFLRLVVAPLQFTSHLVFLFIAATGCPDVDIEVLATGYTKLATGTSSCEWMHSNSWFIIAHDSQNHLLNLSKAKRCRINLCKRHRFAIANFKYQLLVVLRLDTSCTTSLYLLRFSSQLLIALASCCMHCSLLLINDVTADADQLSDDVMSLFVKKFGKFMRRSFNPSSPYSNFHKSDNVSTDMKCFNCDRPGHFAADFNRPRKEDRSRDDKRSTDRYKRDDKRSDDRYKKEERYKRDEETDERAFERSKERSKDRRMRTRSDKRPSRKHDRKVLMAEESTKIWADTDSESSSSSSSSSDSEQEKVHCLMADQTLDDEVFDFSNIEFTREDLVQALNDMVHEYKTLSHTFEEIKAENASLKKVQQNRALATRTELNSIRNAHPKAHASRRTHAQTFLKSFEVQQLRVSTSSEIQLLKWVANERAKQGEEKSLKTTTHLLIQTTSLWLCKHCYQQLISQTKSSKRSVSTNSNDAASQHLDFLRLLISSNHHNAIYYQQQGIRHAYVIISIDSSCD